LIESIDDKAFITVQHSLPYRGFMSGAGSRDCIGVMECWNIGVVEKKGITPKNGKHTKQ